jgi:hypothetical protein
LSSESGKVASNPDGSVDVYFGPNAPTGKESNWIQTVPGKGWFTLLRLYGVGALGDRDIDYLAHYRRALLEGYAVITVVTHDDTTREKVRTLLKTFGAHAMTYFGQFATEIWEG